MERLLQIGEVCDRLKVSKATIYRQINRGQFPKPLRLARMVTRWRERDIDEYVLRLSEVQEEVAA